MKIDDLLLAARIRYPYFSAAYASLTLVERPEFGTVAVDKYWRLYYDQAWLDSLSDDHAVNVVGYHEISHLIRDHGGRSKIANNPPQWNNAADAEINDDLDKKSLPPGGVFPSLVNAPDGLLAEEYLDYFEKESDGKCCGGGSGAGAPEIDGELPSDSAEIPSISSDVATSIREIVVSDTREFIKKNPTTRIPVGLKQWADACEKKIKRNWARDFAALLAKTSRKIVNGKEDFNWKKMNRRNNAFILRPGKIGYSPKIAVCADTTGSMHSSAGDVIGVMRSIARQYGNCDFFSMEMDLKKMSKRKWNFSGGGDGDFSSAIKMLEKKYDLIVVATDGYENWGEPSKKPIFSIMIGENPNITPSWINRLEIS